MADERAMREKLWKALKDDMTLMLGLAGVDEGHSKPMTAQFDDARPGCIWFFTAKDTDLVKAMGDSHRAVAHFVAKDHELFAALHGEIRIDNDRATIDRLWNRFAAAWYEGGKDDPKLQLLRFDPERGQIWLNGNSMVAGIKMLMGIDPKKDYQDKVAEVDLA